jgi:hypothetical protein
MTFLALLVACGGNDGNGAGDSGSNLPTIEGPKLVLNEFLAKNDTINSDEAGEFDDWVEIYNTEDSIVQFDSLYLTDDFDKPTKWALPSGEGIDAGGFALVWCDGSPEQGASHTSFKLDGKGEDLALYYVKDGYQPARLDAITFESQTADVSSARIPDGTLNWQQGTPTPDATNGG